MQAPHFMHCLLHRIKSMGSVLLMQGKSSESAPSYCPESSPPACRVCLEDTSNGALVAPCSCIGSLQWAHPACIQTWINEKVCCPMSV